MKAYLGSRGIATRVLHLGASLNGIIINIPPGGGLQGFDAVWCFGRINTFREALLQLVFLSEVLETESL
jgi:hypothetical protein